LAETQRAQPGDGQTGDHDGVTEDDRPAEPEPSPPDPVAYDSERSAAARARGLSAPYIAGGRDPDPETGLREERFYGRLLLIMVIGIIAGGFILGIVANIITILGRG
jgi:hypothetical protein